MSIWEKEKPASMDDFDNIKPLSYDITGERIKAISDLLSIPTSLIVPTGSRHIERPSKTTSDDDYLVFVGDTEIIMKGYEIFLVNTGWTDCLYSTDGQPTERYAEEGIAGSIWRAFRNGETNIILFKDIYLYYASVAATHLCQKLNVKDKERRIRIFRWFKFDKDLKDNDLYVSSAAVTPWED